MPVRVRTLYPGCGRTWSEASSRALFDLIKNSAGIAGFKSSNGDEFVLPSSFPPRARLNRFVGNYGYPIVVKRTQASTLFFTRFELHTLSRLQN